jgi:hypothetical protein
MKALYLLTMAAAVAIAATLAFSFTRNPELAVPPLPIEKSPPRAEIEWHNHAVLTPTAVPHVARLHEIAAERDPAKQSTLIDEFVDSLGKTDHAASFAALSQFGSASFIDEIRRRVVRTWSTDDPHAAAKWTTALPNGPRRNALLEQVALGWSAENAAEAIAWARQLPDPATSEKIVQLLGLEFARTEPVAALDVAAGLEPGAMRDELCRHAAAQWAASDPQGAMNWAGEIADEILRSDIITTVVSVWAAKDPDAAADFVATGVTPGAGQRRLAAVVAQRRTQQTAAAALARKAIFARDDSPAPQP